MFLPAGMTMSLFKNSSDVARFINKKPNYVSHKTNVQFMSYSVKIPKQKFTFLLFINLCF